MKPTIFNSTDIFKMLDRVGIDGDTPEVIAKAVNTQLYSLGIDASTPDRLSQQRDMIQDLQAKVKELEHTPLGKTKAANPWFFKMEQAQQDAKTEDAKLNRIEEIEDNYDALQANLQIAYSEQTRLWTELSKWSRLTKDLSLQLTQALHALERNYWNREEPETHILTKATLDFIKTCGTLQSVTKKEQE